MSASSRIVAAAVVPGTLLLLPEYAGRIDPIPAIRTAALAAVGAVAAAADRIVVVTAGDREPRHTKGPAGARVAATLLAGAPAEVVVVPWDAPVAVCRALGAAITGAEAGGEGAADQAGGRWGLIIVADGSATRTEKAPGHYDPRAHAYDEAWLTALRGVDVDALLALDAAVAEGVLALGRAPLQVLAGALGDGAAYTCGDITTDDAYGVQHAVALIRLRRSSLDCC